MRARTIFPCLMVAIALTSRAATAAHAEAPSYAPPEFADNDRRSKIESLLPEIEKRYRDYAEERHVPGLVYGIVLEGKLIHTGALGFSNLERQIPATADTRFRIASMTKSFVAMAALKLRDEGKLRLDDPVERYLPEFRRVRPPIADAPTITIRQLMTMTTGLPEDNPWGDQQLAISVEALRKFVGGGLSFSNPPGQEFEYSNLGFCVLGQVVSKVAGMTFQQYITKHILRPLGMTSTVWEFTDVPADKLALGYRWEDEKWQLEPMLHDGAGAAAGGLITTMDDFARYLAFQLDAWPARGEPERGPVRRASVREMHKPSAFAQLNVKATMVDEKTPNPSVAFYGFGLGWSIDSRKIIRISHTGGLPGFGSIYRFAPDFGVGVIAFSNLTYEAVTKPSIVALTTMLEPGRLEPRKLATSAILETRRTEVADLIWAWDVALGQRILAENFYLDRSRDRWVTHSHDTLDKLGNVTSIGPITPENQLRGSFPVDGENGRVEVRFTLTPERVPKVQELALEFLPNP